MNQSAKMGVVGLVSLVVGAAGGAGYGMMQTDEVTQRLNVTTQEKDQAMQEAARLRKLPDDAAKKYGRELGKLVVAASQSTTATAPAPAVPVPASGLPPGATPAMDDGAKVMDGARALLVVRDGFRASLDAVRGAMDSEMDALATELGNPTPNTDKIKELLDGLKLNWPGKEKDLEAATRKLLADLGLAAGPAAPKPAAVPMATPPAAAPAPAPAPADTKK